MYLCANALVLTYLAKSTYVRTTRGRWTLMVLPVVPQDAACLAGACHAFCHLNKPLQHVLVRRCAILTFFAKSTYVRTTRGRWTLMVLQIVPQDAACLAGACHAFFHLNKPLQHVLVRRCANFDIFHFSQNPHMSARLGVGGF